MLIPNSSVAVRFLKERTTNYFQNYLNISLNVLNESRTILGKTNLEACIVPEDVEFQLKCKENCNDINSIGLEGYLNLRYCVFEGNELVLCFALDYPRVYF
jgi:hypothetical protein